MLLPKVSDDTINSLRPSLVEKDFIVSKLGEMLIENPALASWILSYSNMLSQTEYKDYAGMSSIAITTAVVVYTCLKRQADAEEMDREFQISH